MPIPPAQNQNLPPRQRLPRGRVLRAQLRDTWLLVRQFRWPLLGLTVTVLGGGIIYYLLARHAGEPLSNLPEAIYIMLSMVFMQPAEDFPSAWYLEIFYFVMPIIGVILLAQGVTEFGVMLFNRRARGKEWEMAVASTFNNHIILVGLGHLGFRVARSLHQMDQDVVAIELNPQADLVASVKEMGIPVIQDDASREGALEAAGLARARSVILCTQNDSLNLKVALRARRIKPEIHLVLRIFDDDFAQSLQEQFGYTAFSATGMAAPAFAAAATGIDMTRPITVEGDLFSLARLEIAAGSHMVGQTVETLEQSYNVSVVLLRRDGQSDLHPSSSRQVAAGDLVAVLGGSTEISRLAQENR